MLPPRLPVVGPPGPGPRCHGAASVMSRLARMQPVASRSKPTAAVDRRRVVGGGGEEDRRPRRARAARRAAPLVIGGAVPAGRGPRAGSRCPSARRRRHAGRRCRRRRAAPGSSYAATMTRRALVAAGRAGRRRCRARWSSCPSKDGADHADDRGQVGAGRPEHLTAPGHLAEVPPRRAATPSAGTTSTSAPGERLADRVEQRRGGLVDPLDGAGHAELVLAGDHPAYVVRGDGRR